MIFYTVTVLLLAVSFAANRAKTIKALKIAYTKIRNILPAFLLMLVLVSISLYLLPQEVIGEYLGGNGIIRGTLVALSVGSIVLMPGFIVFPLCGILKEQGIPYMVLSGFTTTLMMVGILTLPIEKEYFGIKTALVRNAISFLVALVVAFVTGLVFGEVSL